LNIAATNDPEDIIRVVRVHLFSQRARSSQVSANDARCLSDLYATAVGPILSKRIHDGTQVDGKATRLARDCTFYPFIIKDPRALRELQYLRCPVFLSACDGTSRLIFHLLGNPSDYITSRKRKSWRKTWPVSIHRAPRGLSCILS